jgi:hypothetical protein
MRSSSSASTTSIGPTDHSVIILQLVEAKDRHGRWTAPVRRYDRVGELIYEYERAA